MVMNCLSLQKRGVDPASLTEENLLMRRMSGTMKTGRKGVMRKTTDLMITRQMVLRLVVLFRCLSFMKDTNKWVESVRKENNQKVAFEKNR